MTTAPDDDRIPEDAAIVAILSEQIGTLNVLVTRYRLRERAAVARAERAERALADCQARDDERRTTPPEPRPRPGVTAIADATAMRPLGTGDVRVDLGGVPAHTDSASSADWDELLGEVSLR